MWIARGGGGVKNFEKWSTLGRGGVSKKTQKTIHMFCRCPMLELVGKISVPSRCSLKKHIIIVIIKMFKIILIVLALQQAFMISNSMPSPFHQWQFSKPRLSEETFRTDHGVPINPHWGLHSPDQNPRHFPDPKEEGSYDPPLAKSRFAIYESNGQYSFSNPQ